MAEESKLAEKYENATKFSEEEMKVVKEIQQKYVDVQHKLGQLSVARIRLVQQLEALDNSESELKQSFVETQSLKKNLFLQLQKSMVMVY